MFRHKPGFVVTDTHGWYRPTDTPCKMASVVYHRDHEDETIESGDPRLNKLGRSPKSDCKVLESLGENVVED